MFNSSIRKNLLLILLSVLPTIGCSASVDNKPQKPEKPTQKGEAASLQFNEKGMLIPVARDGTPFAICGTDKRNTCSLFKENITITDFEPIMVTRFEHKINPTCVIYVVVHYGKQFIYFDPTDPNCAPFNK